MAAVESMVCYGYVGTQICGCAMVVAVVMTNKLIRDQWNGMTDIDRPLPLAREIEVPSPLARKIGLDEDIGRYCTVAC
jgi:hypothetical protein